MGKVFVNQTSLRLRVRCFEDLSNADTIEIKYKKPSGITGSWSADVEDALNGIVYHDFTEPIPNPPDPVVYELNESGMWSVWIYVTFPDGRTLPGEVAQIRVYPEGSA